MRIVEAAEMAIVAEGEIPRHVACIMDGNGRWAQMRGLARSNGHEAAEAAVDAAVDVCLALGVQWLTVYAFSTENWRREPAEVAFLMSLQEWLLREEKRQRFKRIGVRLRFVGHLDDPRVPEACRSWLRECEEMTAYNTGLEFVIVFNYGGRAEIVDAVRAIVDAGVPAEEIDEKQVGAAMYLPDMPDIDLLIRTSAEFRLSNFFPWHATYAEFVFLDTLWPDFREGHLYSAVAEYQSRRRRKGSSGSVGDEGIELVKAGDFTELLAIDHLDDALDEVAAALDVALHGTSELVVPARRMLNAGGKRLRPLLTIASAVACDPRVAVRPLDARVRRGAASVELVHVGSLVHDDIMDVADARLGGVPTVNAVEGASQALLVGDFLLARAGVEAAHVSKDVALSLATTISDLCDGQSLEGLHQHRSDRSVDDAIESIRGKTGALMRAACEIGALRVAATDVAPALAEFGMNFGIAFQLVDDLLDLMSTDALMGKPVNNDVKSGVFTVPMLFALERAPDAELMADLMSRAKFDSTAADRCRDLVLASDAIASTMDLVTAFNAKAFEALSAVPAGQTRDGLAQVPQGYLEGILQEKVPGFAS